VGVAKSVMCVLRRAPLPPVGLRTIPGHARWACASPVFATSVRTMKPRPSCEQRAVNEQHRDASLTRSACCSLFFSRGVPPPRLAFPPHTARRSDRTVAHGSSEQSEHLGADTASAAEQTILRYLQHSRWAARAAAMRRVRTMAAALILRPSGLLRPPRNIRDAPAESM
jgi:hypothetical protein